MQNEEPVVELNAPAPVADETKAEPVAEGENTEAKTEVEAEAKTETPEQQEAKKQSKFQRRLDRHKQAAIEAQTEVRLLREELAVRDAKQQAPVGSGEPKRDNFDDYESYLRAVTRFDAKQEATATVKAEREANAGRQQHDNAKSADEKVTVQWTKHEAAFKADTKDYEEVVTDFVDDDLKHFSNSTKRMIVESDVGPQLLYHLATNSDDAERIADLSPTRQIVELGKLEEKMSRPAKRTSNAPAPIDPVKGGASGTKDPAKMNVSEYKAFMKASGSRFVR